MDQYDVIIVGARCAGSATARLLADGGLRVLLVDRATFPSDTVSTHAVSLHGCEMLRQWGLFATLTDVGTPAYDAVTVGIGDMRLDRVEVSAACMAPRRTVLDKVLLDAATAAGAELWEGTAVEGLRRTGERVDGLIAGGRAVKADLVIGADGAHSPTARWVDPARYNIEPSGLVASYAYFADTGIDHPHMFLAGRRVALVWPTNDDLACVAIGGAVSDDGIIGASDDAFRGVVDQLCPDVGEVLATADRVTRFTAFRPQPAYFAAATGPGWALVGDAGLYLDPITGQGISNAFVSAQLLADAVLGDDLADYQRRRDAVVADIADVTAALARMQWSDEEAVGLFLRFREVVNASYEAVTRRATRDLPSTARAVRA